MQSSDRELVIAEFDHSMYPSGVPTLEDAWLGIYQVLWWYDHGLLHIHDAPALWTNKTWVGKAAVAEQHLARTLGIPTPRVQRVMDRMMQLPRWQGL